MKKIATFLHRPLVARFLALLGLLFMIFSILDRVKYNVTGTPGSYGGAQPASQTAAPFMRGR